MDANCTSAESSGGGREQTLLLQNAAFLTHILCILLALVGFQLYAHRMRKKGTVVERRNPTILSLRLGRELLENTLMWAAMLNVSVITRADFGIFILVSVIPITVIATHLFAVLSFRQEIVLHDETIESFDVAVCFHFNSFFAKKAFYQRIVVVVSVPCLMVVALITGAATGRITDVSLTMSECTASFLLAFFSSQVSLKPAESCVSLVDWDYRRFQVPRARRSKWLCAQSSSGRAALRRRRVRLR